jgi:hypothetical protein
LRNIREKYERKTIHVALIPLPQPFTYKLRFHQREKVRCIAEIFHQKLRTWPNGPLDHYHRHLHEMESVWCLYDSRSRVDAKTPLRTLYTLKEMIQD